MALTKGTRGGADPKATAKKKREEAKHKREERARERREHAKTQAARGKAMEKGYEPVEKARSEAVRRARASANLANLSLPRVSPGTRLSPEEKAENEAEIMARVALAQIQDDIAQSVSSAPGARLSGESFLSTVLGPNITAALPIRDGTEAGEATKGGLALDAVLLPLPFLRGPRAIAAGARAATKGEDIGKAAREGFRRRSPGTRLTGTRKVRYGDDEVQFPSSPSWMTAKGQRLWDRASEALGRGADTLRDSDSAVARVIGRSVTPVSSRARVPKQAGKHQRQEGRRRQALRAEEVRTVKRTGSRVRLPVFKSAGAQAAHFWYAQLPSSLRNAEGLKAVRGKMSEELQRLKSGEFEDALDEAIEVAKASGRRAETSEESFAALKETQKLQAVKADVPALIVDVSQAVKKLDQLVANPPKVQDGVIDALRVLMDERKAILVRAGVLNPEVATAREGLISRWLGLEATGEEVYLGHRLGAVRGARGSLQPGGVSVGKTRLPQGVATENTLALARSGRLRQDLGAAVEDWQAAQVYEFHNIAKDELVRMGSPIDFVRGPKPGHVVVNPKGHQLPRRWKADNIEQALAEGFDPEDVLIRDSKEYLENYLAEGKAAADEMIEKAAQAGHAEDLRQVPVDVVKRYYGQFLPTKITVATPGVKKGASFIGKSADLLNDIVYTSLIYSNPGYIPAALAGNLAMAAAHQGALLPVNMMRAGQLLTTGPKRLRDLVKAEVGFGPTQAAASSTSPLKGVGRVVGAVPDNTPRVAALLYEAGRVGAISRTKPLLTENDYRKLHTLLTDPNARPILNDARDRAVQAMVDFDRLGPLERAVAKRFGFVWTWLRGASRYPGRFALDHPIRSAAMGYGAVEYRDDLEERVTGSSETPRFLQQALKLGETEVGGKSYPRVLPTRGISPIGTPLEMLETFTDKPGARTIGEFVNPGITSALQVALGRDRNWYDVGYKDAASSALERLSPHKNLYDDLRSPSGTGLYPEDATRLGRLKRASRVIPYAIDPDVAKDMANEERREGLSKLERAEEDITEEHRAYVKKWERYFKEHDAEMPATIRRQIRARLSVQRAEAGRKAYHGIKKLTDYQRLEIRWAVAMEVHPSVAQSQEAITDYLEKAKGNKELIRAGLNEVNGFVGYELTKPEGAGDYWDD